MLDKRTYLYRDTMLNIDCSFQAAADGKQRCLPISLAGEIANVYPTYFYYSDSGCSQKLYYATKSCTSAKYMFLGSTTVTCPASYQYAVYSMPSVVIPTVLYEGSPGSCSPLSKATLDNFLMSFTFFDLSRASPMAPNQFVAGTTTRVL